MTNAFASIRFLVYVDWYFSKPDYMIFISKHPSGQVMFTDQDILSEKSRPRLSLWA